MAPPASEMDVAITEARLEQLLSEKLMQGYVLMETCCPKCATPLVKNHHMVPKTLGSYSRDEGDVRVDKCVLLPTESFDQPFKPVDGVPMCVACNSHVITQETEIGILEQCDSMRNKGSIYVALNPPAVEPEIIHLEDVVEEDVVGPLPHTGPNAKPFVVDISTTSFDDDGNSHFEITFSPRNNASEGAETKPINLVGEEEEDLESYSTRREIATKVLGAKMLQGYTLQEVTCKTCGMPLMSKKNKIDCVVCPALAKKAKKKLRQKQKVDEEKARLEEKILEMKAGDTLDRIKTVRREIEEKQMREEEEETHRAEETQKAILDEKARILAATEEKKEDDSTHLVVEEQDEDSVQVALAQERARAQLEDEKNELTRLEAIATEEKERKRMAHALREKEEQIAALEANMKAKQSVEAKALAEEEARIAALDDETIANDKSLAMKKDMLVNEHRKRLAGKATLDEEVARLEEERMLEEMEARRLADERRAESESRMIAALEADAAMKALAAEDAIRRAKEALEDVNATKKQIISQTIALAEKEALAETEQTIKGEYEDYREPVILPTDSELENERWETLRMEGRAILTRRILQGWQLLPDACSGTECHMTPLVTHMGRTECVVCGGTGNGKDGVYCKEVTKNEPAAMAAMPPSIKAAVSEAEELIFGLETEEDFEKKRAIYSKEIGKRMLLGWILVDSSCPKCVMPLMMDDLGNTDICVMCGEVKHFDASTIATKEMAALEIIEETAVEQKVEEEPKAEIPVIESADSDLVSTIQKHSTKQQITKRPVQSSDPPAFNARFKVAPVIKEDDIKDENLIPLPTNDFADASAFRSLVKHDQHRDDTHQVDISVEVIANMFLKSPHGYDFHDLGRHMSIREVKELVEIFVVTNVDSEVSDDFKFSVAERILEKMNLTAKVRQQASPPRGTVYNVETPRFAFDEDDNYNMATRSTVVNGKRTKPRPEDQARRLPPISPGPRTTPRSGAPRGFDGPIHTSRSDDMSVVSRANSVASDALESIYDRIDQCKLKLLDPNNTLDEQIATAALLEKLAQAAVAVREMDFLE